MTTDKAPPPHDHPEPLVPENEALASGERRVSKVLAWWQEQFIRIGARAERSEAALHVATHEPHDQDGEPIEGFPVCSICGAIQTDRRLNYHETVEAAGGKFLDLSEPTA